MTRSLMLPKGDYCRRLRMLLADREAFVATSLMATFVAMALFCSTRGNPHADEVMYAETSANIAAGKGPIAWTHANVVPGSVNALAYVPFVYAQAAWIQLLGLSRVAIASFAVLIVAGAAFLLWAFFRQSGLIRDPFSRIFLATGIPMVPSVMTLWRTNRYDVLAVLGISLGLWATTCKNSIAKITLIFLAGMLVGGDGFHPALVTPGLAIVAWGWFSRRDTPALAAYLLGIASGLLLTFGEMWFSGTLGVFRTLMEHNGVAVRGVTKVLIAPFVHHSNIRDNALVLLALVIALGSGFASRKKGRQECSAIIGIAAMALVPMVLTLVGRYNHTYSWLAVVPGFLLAVIAVQSDNIGTAARLAVYAVLTLDVLTGLPTRFGALAIEADRNSYETPSEYIRGLIDSNDVVYASYAAYYPVKKRAAESYFGGAIESMTPRQLARVRRAVLADDTKPRGMFELSQAEVLSRLGGTWEEVGRFRTPRGHLRQIIPPQPKDATIFDFKIFARIK